MLEAILGEVLGISLLIIGFVVLIFIFICILILGIKLIKYLIKGE